MLCTFEEDRKLQLSVQPGHGNVCSAVVVSLNANAGGGCKEGCQKKPELLHSRIILHLSFLHRQPAISSIITSEGHSTKSALPQSLCVCAEHHQQPMLGAVMLKNHNGFVPLLQTPKLALGRILIPSTVLIHHREIRKSSNKVNQTIEPGGWVLVKS